MQKSLQEFSTLANWLFKHVWACFEQEAESESPLPRTAQAKITDAFSWLSPQNEVGKSLWTPFCPICRSDLSDLNRWSLRLESFLIRWLSCPALQEHWIFHHFSYPFRRAQLWSLKCYDLRPLRHAYSALLGACTAWAKTGQEPKRSVLCIVTVLHQLSFSGQTSANSMQIWGAASCSFAWRGRKRFQRSPQRVSRFCGCCIYGCSFVR